MGTYANIKNISSPMLKLTGFEAYADYRLMQGHAVKAHTVNGQAILSGAGDYCMGVLVNTPNANEPCEIVTLGVCEVYVGSAGATCGSAMMSDSSGHFTDQTSTNTKLGMFLQTGTSGQFVSALVMVGSGLGNAASYAEICIPVELATIANGDIVTTITMPYDGEIVQTEFITTVAASTASKASTLNLEIGTTNVTGGELSLTTVGCNTLGKVTAGASVTATNVFAATDTISVEASSTTTFIEGAGLLRITVMVY